MSPFSANSRAARECGRKIAEATESISHARKKKKQRGTATDKEREVALAHGQTRIGGDVVSARHQGDELKSYRIQNIFSTIGNWIRDNQSRYLLNTILKIIKVTHRC